jgi:hypothetical protein
MISYKNVFSLLGFAVVLVVIYFVFFRTASKPWEESGHFVLALRTTPGLNTETEFNIGLDNFELFRKDGSSESVSVLTRRVTLNPENNTLDIILDTYVPIGDYSGFSFVLKSPELRSPWEEDEAPHTITLVQELIRLDIPYTIQKDVTSSVILAFETRNTIHDVDGEKQFLPVIQLETRSNTQITGGENEPVAIIGGDILHSVTFGMDWNGRIKRNFRAKPQKVISEPQTTEITQVATTTEETPLDVSTSSLDIATSSTTTVVQ